MSSPAGRSRVFSILLHGTLYVLGALSYASMVGWGRAEFKLYDWPVSISSLTVLKMGLTQGVMPFHAYFFREEVLTTPFVQQTEFFARVHAILAPHVIVLLNVVSVKTAVVLHVLFMYTLGYLGLLRLCRHNHFDRLGFSALYATFLLGGFIPTKLAVGHLFDAAAYFLLPYVLLYAQRLLVLGSGRMQPRAMWEAVVGLSLVLVYTILLGSVHVVYIELLILGAVLLWNRRTRWALLAVVGLLAWGGAVRFVPILAFNEAYLGPHRRLLAWGGYGSWWGDEKPCSVRSPTCWLSDLADALTVLRPIQYHHDQNWWEFSLYISLAGVALLIAGWSFLLLKWNDALLAIAPRDHRRAARSQAVLCLAGLFFLMLSMGPVYGRLVNPLFAWLNLSHINTIPSRMAVFPLLLFSCYAVAGWQVVRQGEGKRPRWVGLLQSVLIVIVIAAGLEHAAHWNVRAVEASVTVSDQTGPYVLYSPLRQAGLMDLPVSPAYRLAVYASMVASLAYLVIACAWLAVGWLRRAQGGQRMRARR